MSRLHTVHLDSSSFLCLCMFQLAHFCFSIGLGQRTSIRSFHFQNLHLFVLQKSPGLIVYPRQLRNFFLELHHDLRLIPFDIFNVLLVF